ncbi:hypothetical protein [Bacillus pumilus]|uniref:hypothetical protein n=1 Tax=Bacillus pumilus TaxID=1408 RepID=UPI001BA9C687|nr:hypothetical protein [Bacillus pumilus]
MVEITPAAVAIFEVITSRSLLKNEPVTGGSVMENDRPVVNHLSKCPVIRTKKCACF